MMMSLTLYSMMIWISKVDEYILIGDGVDDAVKINPPVRPNPLTNHRLALKLNGDIVL